MPADDTSPGPERRQRILDAALEVFSRKGFHKATNKEIAQAAGGISPGLIYWYFKDKQDLFLSLLQERTTILQLAAHPERLMELPPREALALIGRSYMAMFRAPGNAALFRIVFSEVVRFPQIGELFYNIAARRLFALINQYLQHQIDCGRLRPHDTAIATRSFLGMFIANILAREILRQPEALAASDEQIVATSVEIFARGLEL